MIWPFAVRSSNGYGAYSQKHCGKTKNWEAHAYVCAHAHGPRPSLKHEATHSCGERLCCNPKHLSWATHPAVMAGAVTRKSLVGGGVYRQRIFAAELAYIKRAPESLVRLGLRFGMEPSHMGRLRRGMG